MFNIIKSSFIRGEGTWIWLVDVMVKQIEKKKRISFIIFLNIKMAELVWEYFFFEIASLHLERQILQNELLRVCC